MTFIPEIIAKVNHPMAGRRRAEQFNLMKEMQSGAFWLASPPQVHALPNIQ